MKYKYKVEGIHWDVDEQEDLQDLPEEVIIEVAHDEDEDPGEWLADELSDQFGFCISGIDHWEKMNED